jgi:hypothetical protein
MYLHLIINSNRMDFDDFFENNRRKHGNYREPVYHDADRYSYNSHHSYSGYSGHLKWINIIEKIGRNKKLKLLVLLAGILFLAIAIVLIIILLPFFAKLYDYISQNGLQGLLDGIIGFLDKIWKGSGK